MTERAASDLARPGILTMYGAAWCGDCRRAQRLLDSRGVEYDYVDLVAAPERADDAEALSGRKNIPVLVFPDGDVLVEPADAELGAKLDAVSSAGGLS
ncbi:glutaredoxin family protein [Isoptericola variabilis]|uniref:Glutaredoxin n=1 Tax=Isoptericola variabilis (strain 225) TaxID=743718 RepID=F6FPL4_ISOV2|nr:glutaredoxin family protein [Isoptericola variabilis]AEG44746.1 glutaredoxin [Isoptericola variabilis 225]TWH32359.1 glutaredoxin [Isoptericola variabilis J7]